MKRTLFVSLLAILWAPLAGAAYKCVDERGLTLIGDTPPAGCANVLMYEIGSAGQVLRKIDPTPTPEQLKLRLEEQEKKKEAERQAAEQKRRDIALLSTYSSEREFDMTRDRNIEPINGRIRGAQDRLKAIDERQKAIDDEMEFYKAGKSKTAKTRDPPPALVGEQQRLRSEKTTLTSAVANYERQIAALREQYESDRRRWLELKGNPSARPQETPKAPSTITMVPGAAGRAKCGNKVYECPAGQTYACMRSNGTWYKVYCEVPR